MKTDGGDGDTYSTDGDLGSYPKLSGVGSSDPQMFF